MKRLVAFVTAALAAVMVAAPGWAQTTVTSSGREGPLTCVGEAEVDATNFPITALSTNSVTVTAREVTWSQVLAPLGDGQAPTNATITVRVYRAADGMGADNDPANGLVGTISSSSPTYAGGSATRSGLSQNTLYYVTLEAGPAGRDTQILGRRCFMTGGTYTMTVAPGTSGDGGALVTSGCFAISPRTQQDVRNCLCGRGNNSPRVLGLFTDETQNQALRDSLGCR